VAEIRIITRGSAPPAEDFVLVKTRLAENNSVMTDIICIKDEVPVKTITDRHLSPDVAIKTASRIADEYEIGLICVLNDL
jgi:hypothetical protein